MPDVEALTTFPASPFATDRHDWQRRAKRGALSERVSKRRIYRPLSLPTCRGPRAIRAAQTSRQDLAVTNDECERSTTPGQRRAATGRQPENEAEATRGFLAFDSVAGVKCDAYEAKSPWPRLHGRRGTSTPPGRDAVSSSARGAPGRSRRAPRPVAGQGSDRPPRSSFCRSPPGGPAPLPHCPARADARRETCGPDSFQVTARFRRRRPGIIAVNCGRSNSSREWPAFGPATIWPESSPLS